MTRRRTARAVTAVVAVALTVVALLVWQRITGIQDPTADAVVVNGETYGRDRSKGCRLVNDDGDVLPEE